MPNYIPVEDMSPREKRDLVTTLEQCIDSLISQKENCFDNSLFETMEGDVATAKDICGVLLATLTEAPVTIP